MCISLKNQTINGQGKILQTNKKKQNPQKSVDVLRKTEGQKGTKKAKNTVPNHRVQQHLGGKNGGENAGTWGLAAPEADETDGNSKTLQKEMKEKHIETEKKTS